MVENMDTWEQRHAAEVELERDLRARGLWKVYCAAWTAVKDGADPAEVSEVVARAAAEVTGQRARSASAATSPEPPPVRENAAGALDAWASAVGF